MLKLATTLSGMLWLAACGYDARLGMECPHGEPSCAHAGSVALAADSGVGRPARPDPDSMEAEAGSAAPVAGDAAPSESRDAAAAPMTDAPEPPQTTAACRFVTMAYFACAATVNAPGNPLLRAGEAYTLRMRGDYATDTIFQVAGSTAACTTVTFEPLTHPAGAAVTERCVRPQEDLSLLVMITSGDPQVWVQGLMAEVCDGCESIRSMKHLLHSG